MTVEEPVPYDAGEDFDAGDHGDVVVPAGTDAILFAQQLVDLRDAGFPEDPDDPDGSKLDPSCDVGPDTSAVADGDAWHCDIVGPHACLYYGGDTVSHEENG